jgi:hypothetical protein
MIDLNDPRVAAVLVAAVDRRVDQKLAAAERKVRYGVVAAVDTVNRKASVYIGNDATATPGFVYGPLAPTIGELVRVEMGQSGDFVIAGLRNANAVIAGTLAVGGAVTSAGVALLKAEAGSVQTSYLATAAKRLRYVPLIPAIAAVSAATFTASDSSAQTLTFSSLPASGVVAVSISLIVEASSAHGSNSVQPIHYNGTTTADAAGITYEGAVASFRTAAGFIVGTGGPAGNSRSIKYWRSRGAGTVTWWLNVTGYWTTED